MAQVTVGCKLPNGLHLDHMGKRVTLNGTNSSNIIGGHGLTMVDKDFFEGWLKNYHDHPSVKQGLIFAHDKESNTRAEALEKVNNRSGFEGINPDKPGHGVKKDDGK